MDIIIVSGLSGAGKSRTAAVLEDLGYYCVDNIPSTLLSTLYKLCKESNDSTMKRVAVVVDVRGNDNYEEMYLNLEKFRKENHFCSYG